VEISKIKEIRFEPNPIKEKFDFEVLNSQGFDGIIKVLGDGKHQKLDAAKGSQIAHEGYGISAYDESFNNYFSLAGSGLLTSHSLIIHGESDYISSNNLTFYFYTRSEEISKQSEYIKKSTDTENDSRRDYAEDRANFILDAAPDNSILFIDGPLIGGVSNIINVKMNDALLERNIIPLFIVKNSNSNLVTDYVTSLKGKYNSDMHWAYTRLRPRSRTNFFVYEDQVNSEFSKIFCYLKTFDISPQRVEFHPRTYEKYQEIMDEMMHLICYLILVQGNLKNPQLRSIAIAEKFARETLDLFDMSNLMKTLGLVPTMNQERGFG
jgi:hypothetical protein